MYDILLMGLFGIVNLILGFVIGVVVESLVEDNAVQERNNRE